MPGDYWQKFAGLRGFFGYWMAHPGKKLLFMGGEFAQFAEWNFDDSLDWHLVQEFDMHRKMQAYCRALNKFYVDTRAFWQVDFDWNGFQWIDPNDNNNSIVSFIRKAEDSNDFVICISNFTPEVHQDYRIGVPAKGSYIEVFNSDGEDFGGSGVKNAGEIQSQDVPWHNREQSIKLTIPPLSTIYLRLKRQDGSNASFPEVNEQVEARGFAVAGEKDSTEVAAKVKRGTAKKTAAKTTTKKASKKTTAVKAPKAKANTKAKAASKTATRKRAVKTPLEEAAVNA
jgi:1,4-alpha-glucan branching enzyme